MYPVIVSVSITQLISWFDTKVERATVKQDWNNLSPKGPIHSLTCQTPHPTERRQLQVNTQKTTQDNSMCTLGQGILQKLHVRNTRLVTGHLIITMERGFLANETSACGCTQILMPYTVYSGTQCAHGIQNRRGWQTLP